MKKVLYLTSILLVLIFAIIAISTSLETNLPSYKAMTGIIQSASQSLENIHFKFKFPWEKVEIFSKEQPKHLSKLSYDEIFVDSGGIVSGEISRFYDEEQDQRFAKIKGYAHYYTFSDFGIIVGTNEVYDPEFLEKNPKNLFNRYIDANYDVIYKGNFYIQRFEKSKNQKFDINFLKKDQTVSGCDIVFYDKKNMSGNPLNMPGNYIIYSLDFTEDNSYCEPNLNNIIYFVYNPKRSENYYKISWEDGCAPSCGVPKSFEILNK